MYGQQLLLAPLQEAPYAAPRRDCRYPGVKRRKVIEPMIGHVKQNYGMQRCWLKGRT